MKHRLSALLAAILALLALLSLASCGETTVTPTESTDTTAAAEVTEAPAQTEPEETKLTADIPDVKYDTDFVIASGFVTETKYTTNAIVSDEITGDSINDAIYNRTVKLETLLGIKIVVQDVSYSTINKVVKSGTREYDIGTATLSEIMNCVNNGSAVNMKNIETAHLEMPWWDQNANEKFCIGPNLYYTLSDFFITGIDNCRCIYFNKDLAADLSLGNLYELVEPRQWTIEKMQTMSMQAKNDNNGDGAFDQNDRLGIVNNATTFYEVMLTGCNAELVKQGANGIPYFCPFDEADFFLDVYTKLLDLFSKENHYYICSTTVSRDMFSTGNSLFTTDTMYLCSKMRQTADISFGIMPVPLFNSDQERYMHVSPNPDVFFVTPGSAEELERDGVILEAASYYSSSYGSDDALMPTYFQLALVSKSTNDMESASNLQLVHDNISYVSKIVGTSFSQGIFNNFEAANYNITSYINGQKKTQERSLKNVLDSLGVE